MGREQDAGTNAHEQLVYALSSPPAIFFARRVPSKASESRGRGEFLTQSRE